MPEILDEILDKMPATRGKRGATNTASGAVVPTRDRNSLPFVPPTVVIFSADRELTALIEGAAQEPWNIERCKDPSNGRQVLSHPNIRLVIVDDEVIQEDARGWLLDRIRRYVPQALLMYIAGSHSPAGEKRARGHSAQYYTAKPLDMERIRRVVESFMRTAAERDWKVGLAPSTPQRRSR